MLSIVIPVLNEEESLVELHRQILEACQSNAINVEIIFVDDGSTDKSWSIISKLADEDPRVFGIRFRRNFGKAAALTAGMNAVSGNVVMMMDADLQDDPAEIPNFLTQIDNGYDVVNGWKERRLDPWHKVYPSKVFNWMVGQLTGLHLHDHNCGIKMFRREVTQEVRLYGEMHRFIAVLAHARGFKVAEVPVHHRPRQFGHSKYGIRRFLRGFLDLLTVKFLTGFGQRPQHMLGGIGLFFFGLGTLGLAYLGLMWVFMNVIPIFSPSPIGGRPLLLYSVASMLLGAQGISLGMLAELIVANTGRERDTYSVSERTPLSKTREQEPTEH
ncbi:Undecaprenyl-phosphate 4-deoxy-4-formamido-L-arabinose transferase [Thalassoglobus neptunius]|uniref:Undecaprenyl-phosphate 4-deoxy-4-formamido-L-arabinose transferase n=1 Tax=Thalassoglobus neptunius TaxID=1938619 RepID=A0A5C5X5N6_9PLAN|nr:glycosyltransferase family 2 protein [Thalassoglobus neptunius]TWT58336.1 Undecaprenyl-phosphate 4-deoxy-4-formamido-L-arabinose transferase [Thalassoglobus neptunius]